MNGIASIRILGMVTGLLLVAASGAQETPLPQATLPPTGAVEVAPGTVVPGPATLDSPERAQKLLSFPVLRPDPETLPAGLELAEVGWQPYPEEDIELVALHYRYPGYTLDLHIERIALGEEGVEMPRPAAHATLHPLNQTSESCNTEALNTEAPSGSATRVWQRTLRSISRIRLRNSPPPPSSLYLHVSSS